MWLPRAKGEGIERILFKSTYLQLVDKTCRSNAEHSDYQLYCIINFEVAKKLHLITEKRNNYVM